MVFYIFLVAAVNLVLGFGVATYLGWRYHTSIAAGDPWGAGATPGPSIDGGLPGEENAAAGAETSSTQTLPRQSSGVTTAATAAEAQRTPTGAQSEQSSPAQSPPTPQSDQSPSEKCVDDLSREVQQYHEQVAQADEKLRACAENPEAAQIEAILGSLLGATQRHLESRKQVHGTFQRLHQGQPETDGICDDVQAAIEREDEQIQRTSVMIEGFAYDHDLEEGCRRMRNQTDKLIDSNGQLREVLDEVKAKLAEKQPPRQNVHSATGSGTPREPSGRTALEAELRKWWNQQPDQAPHLSVAIIELDDSARLEQHHGGEVLDKILRAVGQLGESSSGGEGSLLRLPRQQFSFLFPQTEIRLAAHMAERLRQTVQQAHLHHEGAEIRVTISCAVVGAASEDTPATLAERADMTLQEAKRYGCNRTFLHDGKYPTPVVPPVFSLPEKQVTL